MQALMTRFGGHPYDELDLLPFNVVDPVKRTPLENLWGMGHNRNELVRDTRDMSRSMPLLHLRHRGRRTVSCMLRSSRCCVVWRAVLS
jgi:hypothetical protein